MTAAILDRVKKLTRFQESYAASTDKVDREAGIIYGVRVLGEASQNDNGARRYSPQARRSAIKLYEGVTVYIDHRRETDSPKRGLLEEFGILKNLRETGEAVYGDLHYLKSHSATDQILERVERGMPIGLSHDAEGPVNRKGREVIVEDITHVFSVDLVRNPATNSTLFESVTKEAKPMTVRKVRQVLEAHASQVIAAKRLLEMDGDPMEAEMAYEPVAEEPSPEQDVNAAVASLVMAILGEELSIDEKLAKIEGVLRSAMNEPTAEPSEPASGGEPAADAAMTEEVKQLRKQLAQVSRNEAIREACDEHGIALSLLGKDRLSLAREASSDAAARKLIESWVPALAVPSKPQGVASRRLTEELAGSYEQSRKQW